MLSQMTIKYINALNKHGDNFDPTEWLKGEISAARGSRKHGEREAPAADREKNAGAGQRSSLPQQATPLRLAQPNDDIPRRFRSKNQEQDEISRRLSEVSERWENYQESRDRDAIYPYLSGVFGIVRFYARENRTRKLLRRACEYSGIFFYEDVDPFATIIRCTSENSVSIKDVSKWSRALRYVDRTRRRRISVKKIIKAAGGINACACGYAKLSARR
jgi:hypothetical protein